jgi:hypothetical protein
LAENKFPYILINGKNKYIKIRVFVADKRILYYTKVCDFE